MLVSRRREGSWLPWALLLKAMTSGVPQSCRPGSVDADESPCFLEDCKGVISETGKRAAEPIEVHRVPLNLPAGVLRRLRDYAMDHMRSGRVTERFLEFATQFIAAIGPEGDKQINERTLLGLAGRGADYEPATLKRWKRHLVAAGILRSGWARNVIRGRRASLYQVQPWVKEELDAMSASCGSDGRPVPPAKA